jgi:hypothetical protein
LTSSGFPLSAFRSSPESDRHVAAAVFTLFRSNIRNCLPCGFFPFDVFPTSGSHLSPRGNHPLGYVAFSAFLTLSRLCSTRGLPAMFHAGPALGVSPSRVLRHSQSDRLSRAYQPSCGSQTFLFTVSTGFGSVGVPRTIPRIPAGLSDAVTSRPAPLQGFFPCEQLPLSFGLFTRPRERDPPGLPPP